MDKYTMPCVEEGIREEHASRGRPEPPCWMGVIDVFSMLEFYADFMSEDMVNLRVWESEVLNWGNTPDQTRLAYIFASIRSIGSDCVYLGLDSSEQQVKRIVNQQMTNSPTLSAMIRELRLRIQDELTKRMLFIVPKEKTRFWQEPLVEFGGAVLAFHSARSDFEDASKCYALGRNTACVFHLMRVMESGLRALGKSLNDPNIDPSRNPTWEAILKKCDDQLALPRNRRCAEWMQDEAFFSTATANLRAVKTAWRNTTLHIEMTYDEETALDVFNAVKSFIKHLATNLRE